MSEEDMERKAQGEGEGEGNPGEGESTKKQQLQVEIRTDEYNGVCSYCVWSAPVCHCGQISSASYQSQRSPDGQLKGKKINKVKMQILACL